MATGGRVDRAENVNCLPGAESGCVFVVTASCFCVARPRRVGRLGALARDGRSGDCVMPAGPPRAQQRPALSCPSPPPPPLKPRAMSDHAPSTLAKAFARVDLTGHDLPPSPAPSSPSTGKRYALATELVYTESADQYHASSTPIYQVLGPSAPPTLALTVSARLQRSSKPPVRVVGSTTTRAPATRHDRTLKTTWPR